MSELQNARLIEVVRGLTDKVHRFREQYRGRNLGEENTKAALITPLLTALGWNTSDPDEVQHEYRHTPKDNPVDYCLRLERTPKLVVEAKGFGEDLADHKWLRQTLSYATMVGAEWCVLTDGNEYRLYNASAPVDAEQKLFFRVSLSDGRPEEVVKVLCLISRSNMTGPLLSEHWKRYHADRRVKGAVRELVDAAEQLVPLIRERIRDLSDGEIAQSIRRLDIRIEAPESPYEPSKPVKPLHLGQTEVGEIEVQGDITLAALIAAKILPAPLKLFRKTKGQTVEADLLPDGKVRFQGVDYPSCSQAAGVARGQITGSGPKPTNGWVFWQYRDAAVLIAV
jgi:predicted type IV restriction endonuclease